MTARATWVCLSCDERGQGSWSEVDRSAVRHVELTQHITETRTVGSIRQREVGIVRDLRPGWEG